MQGLLVAAIVLLVLSMAVLAVGVLLLARGLGKLGGSVTSFLDETKNELVPTLKELRQTLQEVDGLTGEIKEKIQRVDGVITHVETLVDGRVVLTAAAKAITGSRVTAVSLLEGVKQGLRVLRGAGANKREESVDD